jgi:hypothetical protein
VLLPTLAFVGLVTFERVLQSGLEDLGYARRIALLRGYYFDNAPELAPYLLSVPSSDRLRVQGLPNDRWQGFRIVVALTALVALTRFQHAAWKLAAGSPLIVAEVESDPEPAARLLPAVPAEAASDADGLPR